MNSRDQVLALTRELWTLKVAESNMLFELESALRTKDALITDVKLKEDVIRHMQDRIQELDLQKRVRES